jgi:hypothetical protein
VNKPDLKLPHETEEPGRNVMSWTSLMTPVVSDAKPIRRFSNAQKPTMSFKQKIKQPQKPTQILQRNILSKVSLHPDIDANNLTTSEAQDDSDAEDEYNRRHLKFD